MKTAQNHKNNVFLSYLIFLVAFFVLVFATMNFYEKVQVSRDSYETQENTRTKLEEELTQLNNLQSRLEAQWSEDLEALRPYLAEVNEKNLIDYFYSYAETENSENDVIVLRNVSIWKEELNDIWFKERDIVLSVIFAGENTLFSFLNELTSKESPYKFFISDFTYPMNEGNWNIQAEIPLVIYYK